MMALRGAEKRLRSVAHARSLNGRLDEERWHLRSAIKHICVHYGVESNGGGVGGINATRAQSVEPI